MIMADSTLFIDIVLWAVYILLAAAVGATIWSTLHGIYTHDPISDPLASRRTSIIGYLTAGFVAVVMVLTYLFASTKPLTVNDKPFTNTMWLRLTDMFIYTSILLICVCSAIVVIAKFRR